LQIENISFNFGSSIILPNTGSDDVVLLSMQRSLFCEGLFCFFEQIFLQFDAKK
jgi:hypothetical protein